MNQLTDKIIPVVALLAIVLPLLIAFIFILKLALYSRRLKMNVETTTMVGLVGRAESDIANQGMVFVRGELWHAQARVRIPRGAGVRVTGCQHLALEVEALQERHH